MATVLIQYGEAGPDGTPPPRAYFQLIEGKLHMPTIRLYFRLANVALDGVVYPTDIDGFTYNTFIPNSNLRVTGDPDCATPTAVPVQPARPTRILLIRTNDVYSEPEHAGGKRKVMQGEENLGLWTLPPPEQQPRTLADLTAAIRSFLQVDQGVSWFFKYRYHSDLVPIVSDSALAEAFEHFRATAAQYPDDEASQRCRLYLHPGVEEVGQRDLIRARITGILDAAAAHSAGRESVAVGPLHQQAAPPTSHLSSDTAAAAAANAAAVALLSGHPQAHHPHGAAAAAALAAAAAAGYAQYPWAALPQMSFDVGHEGGSLYGGQGGLDGDGDGDDEGDVQGEHGSMSGLLGIPRQSGSEGAGGSGPGQVKKESKTRHADGRFKNETQHLKKMGDMNRKIAELFDGAINGMVQVVDHKKILCMLCSHACTAYSAYHTDCVRKHFLRHHEATLRERSVDVGRWRKEYEVSQKVKRQQQQQQEQQTGMVGPVPPALGVAVGPQGGINLPPGILLSSLQSLGVLGGGDNEAAQKALQLLALAGQLPPELQLALPLLAQSVQQASQAAAGIPGAGAGHGGASGGLGAGGGAGGGPLSAVSALLLQAQMVSHNEEQQLQAAGALSGLGAGGGAPAGGAHAGSGQQTTPTQSLVSQLNAALAASSASPGGAGGHVTTTSTAVVMAAGAISPSVSGAAGLAASSSGMARLASGTVTTEMPLPLTQSHIATQAMAGSGGVAFKLEPGAGIEPDRIGSGDAGQGAVSGARSQPVVTTDMASPPS